MSYSNVVSPTNTAEGAAPAFISSSSFRRAPVTFLPGSPSSEHGVGDPQCLAQLHVESKCGPSDGAYRMPTSSRSTPFAFANDGAMSC